MNELDEVKMRLKRKRRMNLSSKSPKGEEQKSYVNNLIARILISIIIFFACIIAINTSPKASNFISKKVLKENISFSKVANAYNKYFGNIIPFEDIYKDEAPVSNEKLTYDSIDNYKDGFVLSVKKNYLVPVLAPGVVVFIGEKEGLGNTIIVQGTDEIDYWYSGIENESCSLYDYVEKGTILAATTDDKLYLTFKKGSTYLDYDEVIE